jgi:hypothetical protein
VGRLGDPFINASPVARAIPAQEAAAAATAHNQVPLEWLFDKQLVYFPRSGTNPNGVAGLEFYFQSCIGVTIGQTNNFNTGWVTEQNTKGLQPFFNEAEGIEGPPEAYPVLTRILGDPVRCCRNNASIFFDVFRSFALFTEAFTIFAVVRGVNGLIMGSAGGSSDPLRWGVSTSLENNLRVTLNLNSEPVSHVYDTPPNTFIQSGVARLVAVRWTNGSPNGALTVKVDGVVVLQTATDPGVLLSGNFSIGGQYEGSVASLDMWDAVGYNVALSDVNMTAVETWLLANSGGFPVVNKAQFNPADLWVLNKTVLPQASTLSRVMVDDVLYNVTGVDSTNFGPRTLLRLAAFQLPPPPVPAPSPPWGFREIARGASTLTFLWFNDLGLTSVEIEKKVLNGSWSVKVVLAGTATQWQDPSVNLSEKWRYRARAFRAGSGYSAYSLICGEPETPVLAVAGFDIDFVDLSWGGMLDIIPQQFYEVWRSLDGGAFEMLTQSGNYQLLTYHDGTVEALRVYRYKVRARVPMQQGAVYTSVFSNEVEVIPDFP